jgi:TrmH family RNA methyltransferase
VLGRHNPRFAALRRIARGEDPELTVVDGSKLVLDLVRAGVPVLELFGTSAHLPAILQAAQGGTSQSRPEAFLIDDATACRIAPSQHGQGVLAVVRRPSALLRIQGVVLFLDSVQDPGNIGGVVRSAAALGATGVVCSVGCADPFSPRAVRAAAGQSFLLPVLTSARFDILAAAFEAAGGQVVGTCAGAGLPLSSWRPRPPVLLALGNEGSGLSPEVHERCSIHVSIPLAANVESLNVAVSAALMLAFAGGLVPSPILE